MCAAPGSKTAQLIEALHAEDTEDSAMPGVYVCVCLHVGLGWGFMYVQACLCICSTRVCVSEHKYYDTHAELFLQSSFLY